MTEVAERKETDFDADAAERILDEILAGESVRKETKKAKLAELVKKIRRAKDEKGYTWAQLTEKLSGAGTISKDTLRHAIRTAEQEEKAGVAVKAASKKKSPIVSTPVKATGTGGHGAKYDLGG
jgi:hypothetical protein